LHWFRGFIFFGKLLDFSINPYFLFVAPL
jgi:hypothetical protein